MNKPADPFGAALARGLGRMRGDGGPDCPDPSLLAAYAERALSGAELERLDRHAAECARCQSMLAAIAAGAPDESQASAAALIRRWRWPAIAAGVSGLVAATLMLALWRSPGEMRLASAPMIRKFEPGQEAERRQAEAPSAQEPAQPRLEKQRSELPRLNALQHQGEPMESAGSAAQAEARARRIERAEVSAGAPGAFTALGGAAGLARSTTASIEKRWAVVVSADNSARWRLGPGGAIARADASGLWSPEASGVSSDLLAGAAPSAKVCWAVGRAGTILRTADGEHWEKIASPTTSDLTGVAAQSALSARVTSRDRRSFATSDGGATWHPDAP